MNLRRIVVRSAVALLLVGLSAPAPALGQELFPVIDSHGSVHRLANGGTLVTATGEASAIGYSEGGGVRSHVGWLRVYYGRIDRSPPSVVAPADPLLEQENLAGASLALPEPTVQDDKDPNPDLLVSVPDLGLADAPFLGLDPLVFPLGDTVVIYTAVDSRGNEASDSMTVTVVDTTAPTLVVPGQVEVEATSPAGSVVALPAAQLSDVCDANPTLTSDAPARFPLGDTRVTFTAVDASGNRSTAATLVRIVDTTPPILQLGVARLEAEQTDLAGSTVELPVPLVRDNGTATAEIVVVDNAPEIFPLGDTTVTFTATDTAGNTAQAELVVSVADRLRPRIELLDSADGFRRDPVTLRLRVTDVCDAAPTLQLDPAPTALAPVPGEPGVFTARYEGEGLFDVTVLAEDSSGNTTTLSGILFGIERQAPSGTLAAIEAPAPVDQPGTWPVYYRGEAFEAVFAASDGRGDAVSGIRRVQATLLRVDPDTGQQIGSWPMIDLQFPLEGIPLAALPSRKDLRCDNPQICLGTGALQLDRVPLGSYRIDMAVTDAAGNQGRVDFPFHLTDLLLAIRTATVRMEELLAGAPGAAAPQLQVAHDLLGWDRGGAQAPVHTGAYYALSEGLLGNTLLYLQDVIKVMQIASQRNADIDTSPEQEYLTRGALAETRLYWIGVVAGGVLLGDANIASDHLGMARASLVAGNYSSVYLDLMHALFFSQNEEQPLRIFDDRNEVEAMRMMATLEQLLRDYLDVPAINGADCVDAAVDHIVTARTLAEAGGNYNLNTINLMLELNSASDVLHSCIPEYSWVRYWQWGLVQVVKSYVQRGRYASGLELGCGAFPDDANCHERHPLMGEASCRYASGLALFDERQVDEALDVYVNAKCLMVELYNYAFPADAIDMPADCAGVPIYECFEVQ